jgi:3-oxoacyl-[acyl-carrier protein] reductase
MMFENKVVVVTGSSSGIGKSVAMAFAKEGAKVVINSKTNVEGGDAVVREIKSNGGSAIHIQADLSDPASVSSFFKKVIECYGTVDVLINNSGRTVSKKIEDSERQDWIESFDENFMSAVLCSKEVIDIMKKAGKGAIINTSSIRGLDHTGREEIMAYSAAKAALNNFTKTLAKELAPNITVNAIAPGFIRTPYMDKVSDELIDKWLSLVPIKRFIEPDEIARAYTFLASSDYITGSILVADGGFTLKIGKI